MLSDSAKLSDGKNMWEKVNFDFNGNINVYRSSYWWSL